MIKLIRGKIVPKRPTNAASAGTAVSSTGESTVIENADSESETETKAELNPYRDGLTFAPPSAPWVGTEQAWRSGIVPPPHEDWINYKMRIEPNAAPPPDDLTLTDIEVAAILSTLPPSTGFKQPAAVGFSSQVFKYAAVAAFTAVSALALFGTLNRSETHAAQVETLPPAVRPEFSATAATASAEAFPTPSVEEATVPALEEPAPSTEPPVRRPIRKQQRRAVFSPRETSEKTPEIVTESSDVAKVDTSSTADTTESEAPIEKADFNVSNPYTEPSAAKVPAQKSAPLSRKAVREVMENIAPQVSKCALGGKGKLILKVEVSGATGRVVNAAVVNAPFANSSVGFCAARAVRFAKFPKFDQDAVTIKYPFNL